ncbi:hypothetical protein HDU76_012089, partial [Blyttiomyces sp. JEL0837]
MNVNLSVVEDKNIEIRIPTLTSETIKTTTASKKVKPTNTKITKTTTATTTTTKANTKQTKEQIIESKLDVISSDPYFSDLMSEYSGGDPNGDPKSFQKEAEIGDVEKDDFDLVQVQFLDWLNGEADPGRDIS